MPTTGNPGPPPSTQCVEWVRQAADALAERLRAGRVPRPARRAARALLAEAFEALEGQGGTLRLAHRLDRAATPPGPRIGFRKRMGVRLEMSAIDHRLVDGLIERWEWGEAVEARIQRFIDGLGDEVAVRLATLRAREGDYPRSDLSLTEG